MLSALQIIEHPYLKYALKIIISCILQRKDVETSWCVYKARQ